MYVRDYVRPARGQRILDIGCGPADVLEHFPDVEYFGIDLSPKYIEAAQSRFGNRGKFLCMDAADFVVNEPGSFDIVMANGLLHHLTDDEARSVFSIAKTALKKSGYMVSFDGCFLTEQSLVVQTLLRMDRGKFVRKRESYIELAKEFFDSAEGFVRDDFYSNLPYSTLFMVCGATARKNAPSSDLQSRLPTTAR
jgi:Trans-aconitate methyltransferase